MILTVLRCSKCEGNIYFDEYTRDEFYCLLCGKVFYLVRDNRLLKLTVKEWRKHIGEVYSRV